MVQGRKRRQKTDPLLPEFQTHPWKRSPRKQQWMFQECRRFGTLWQRLWAPLEERISLLPSREFGIIVHIKPFTAGMLSASFSPHTRILLHRFGSKQELLNIVGEGNICPQSQQDLLWRFLMRTRSCVLWKEHPSWEQGLPWAEFWEGEVPKALCWLQLQGSSTRILFVWFHSAPGMIKPYKYIYILCPYKNRYIIWRWGWGNVLSKCLFFCLLSALKIQFHSLEKLCHP